MDLSFSDILKVLKNYWTEKYGNAGHDVARTVIELITNDFSEYNSDITYKNIFKSGPSNVATSKILNNLANVSKFANFIDKNISDSGRKNLAKELKGLSDIKMDRGNVGARCYKKLTTSSL